MLEINEIFVSNVQMQKQSEETIVSLNTFSQMLNSSNLIEFNTGWPLKLFPINRRQDHVSYNGYSHEYYIIYIKATNCFCSQLAIPLHGPTMVIDVCIK